MLSPRDQGRWQGAKSALLVFASMLSSTLLIPAVRPFFAAFHPGMDGAMHAFMSLNMLGAVVGAPLLAAHADRLGKRRTLVVVLAVLDGVLLFACSLPLPTWLVLTLRTLQGAANVGALSVLMGALGRARGESAPGGSVGLLGGAVIAAVAAGTPMGVLLMAQGVALPLQFGAACAFLVAGLAWLWMPTVDAERVPRASVRGVLREHPLLRIPTAWMLAERFTVGCFVVTFSLYAHHELKLSDADTGILYSWFLMPFALFSWPMGRFAERIPAACLMAAGALVYGVAFMMLGHVTVDVLPPLLLCAGTASAAIYSGALYVGATLAPANVRSTAMGLLNAGGTLGMMLGTALSGIVSAVLMRQEWTRAEVSSSIFTFAGACQILVLAWSASRLWRARSVESPVQPALQQP